MSKGTDRDIVDKWISSLNMMSAVLDDMNFALFWPIIKTAPEDQQVAVGDTCTFTVEVANVTAYQWKVYTPDGASDIPGATSNSYSFTVASSDYDNLYQCKMIGKVPTAISSTDLLAVLPVTT